MPPERFEGTLAECLSHFSKTFAARLVENKCQTRNLICDLIGINRPTGLRWFGKMQTIPSGVNRLKLQLILEMFGYVITERTGVSDAQQELADQLALGVIDTNDRALLSFVSQDNVLRWADGKTQPTRENLAKLLTILMSKRISFQEKRKSWEDTLSSLQLVAVTKQTPTRVVVTQPTHSPERNRSDDERAQAIEVLAHLVLAAKPLAVSILSDDFSPEERTRLRELATVGRSNGVFELSNLLNRLCGEKARDEIRSQLATSH